MLLIIIIIMSITILYISRTNVWLCPWLPPLQQLPSQVSKFSHVINNQRAVKTENQLAELSGCFFHGWPYMATVSTQM